MRVSICIAMAFAVLAASAGAQAPREARKALEESAVMIAIHARGPGSGMWFGSGFVLGGGKLLATNYHVAGEGVVDGMQRQERRQLEMTCLTRAGTLGEAIRQDDSWFQDISLVSIGSAPVPGMSRARRFASLRSGESVYTLGNPGGMPWTYSSGRIAELLGDPDDSEPERRLLESIEDKLRADGSRYRRHRYDRMVLVGPGFARPGNSGGAVVDADGRLVGIVFALILSEDGDERALVIPADYLPMMSNSVGLAFSGETVDGSARSGAAVAPTPESAKPAAARRPKSFAADRSAPSGAPSTSAWLVRHYPLDEASRERIAGLLARANPDDAALCERILGRTREIAVDPADIIGARTAKVSGSDVPLVLWSSGNTAAATNPSAFVWFLTKVNGNRRVFATMPEGTDASVQVSIGMEDGSQIAIWPTE